MTDVDSLIDELRERMSIIDVVLRAVSGAEPHRPQLHVIDGGGQTTPGRALLRVIR